MPLKPRKFRFCQPWSFALCLVLIWPALSSAEHGRPTAPSIECPEGTRLAGKAPSPKLLAKAARTKLARRRSRYVDFAWCSEQSFARQKVLGCTLEILERGYRRYCEKPDGTKHGPALGWSQYGELLMSLTYRDGREHGTTTSWYSGGQKESEIDHQDGRRHGPFKSWHRNGQLC